MKSLPIGFGHVSSCMKLGVVMLGFLAVLPETGHATARTEGARTVETRAATSRAAASPNTTVSTPSRKSAVGCNEALDALALCALPKNSTERSSGDEAVQPRQAVGRASEVIASEEIAVAAKDAGGAPFPTLPVLAFSLAIAGVLLGAFNFLKAGRARSARQAMVRSLGLLGYEGNVEVGRLKKSPTAAIAKERLLQFRT